MASNIVLVEESADGILTLTLNRPDYHNAFNEEVIKKFHSQLLKADQDSHVRIVIIRANGKHFSAGADLGWMKKMISYSEAENISDAMTLMSLLKTLYSMSKPTIALTHGSAIGGGVGLLACCDIVLAEEEANFCFSEVKLGLIPATIAPYVIRAMGSRATQYLFLTAKRFDAITAQRLGLVHEIVPQKSLDSTCQTVCDQLLSNGPFALKATKGWLAHLDSMNEEFLVESAKLIAKIRTSAEAQEGLKAFFEKRKAQWDR